MANRTNLEKKILKTVLIFSFLALLIIGAIIVPTVFKIKDLDQKTMELHVAAQKRNEQALAYHKSLKQLEKIKGNTPVFEDYIFKVGQELKLITMLENLAAKTGVGQKIDNSDLDAITNNHAHLSITIAGSYQKVLNYLDGLEHLSYFITVTRLSVTPTDPSQKTDQTVLSIDLILYAAP